MFFKNGDKLLNMQLSLPKDPERPYRPIEVPCQGHIQN